MKSRGASTVECGSLLPLYGGRSSLRAAGIDLRPPGSSPAPAQQAAPAHGGSELPQSTVPLALR